MISSQFCGYVLVSLLDSEDQVDHLNIFPHVFSERMILYKPNNVNLMEMCALLSMIENAKSPSIGLCREVLGRLTLLHSKCNNLDSLFLYNGARTLLSTLVKYRRVHPGLCGTNLRPSFKGATSTGEKRGWVGERGPRGLPNSYSSR